MSRKSIKVQISRFYQKLPLTFLRIFESPLTNFNRKSEKFPRMIILLALPRSGSTLTYQILIHSLQPLYLSNLWNMLYLTPLFGGILSEKICNGYKSNFISNHGFIDGTCGPAEGLRFWSYWLGVGINEYKKSDFFENTALRRSRYLNRVLSYLTNSSKPMVTGYIGHILALKKIQSMYPNAVFIRLHRDPLSNADSILKIRQTHGEDWFSVYPIECLNYKNESVYKQIASQVYWLNKRIDNELQSEQVIHISYEKLCINPYIELKRVIEFCNEKGMKLQRRADLPREFKYRVVVPFDSDDAHTLAYELANLQNEHGPLKSSEFFKK